jgi:arginine repressor
MNKTKNLVTEILKEREELNSVQIMEELKGRDYEITNDSLAKNLKEMTKSGELTRYGEKKEQDIAWYYYYKLNKNNNLK